MGDCLAKRKIYLNNQPKEEALEIFLGKLEEQGFFQSAGNEIVMSEKAFGRVTAGAVWAAMSSPHYPAAAMDGVAVKSRNTFSAQDTAPLALCLGEEAIEVDTGDPLPPGFDAVIMVENLNYRLDGMVEITSPAVPGQNVRQVGEDVVVGEMLLPGGHLITAVDVGGLIAGGVLKVEVKRPPVVAIMPTGDELVPAGDKPSPGEIPEFNSFILSGLVSKWGGQPAVFPITPDDPAKLEQRILEAVQKADIILVNAGSSAGREDFAAQVISNLGKVLTHGVAIKPGKPVILGIIKGKPVVGLPGYPVSAVLAAELFVQPLVYRFLAVPVPQRPTVVAALARKVYSPLGPEEYLRVKLGRVGDRLVATPISRGAGVITSLMRADGLLVVPRLSEGFAQGEQVQVELLKSLAEIEQTVVAVGSHDLSLDILAHHLKLGFPDTFLSSANVGSLGGLMALKRGEAHLAGIHLLDPLTGVYNETYVTRYLAGQPVVLVNLAYRQQGLIVSRKNPLGITLLRDLVRPGLVFVNRQRGAGTRILLDYLLEQEGINPADIHGYHREEFTHLAVAVAVASGTADVGMGIQAAAEAQNLDFLPVAEERYDLCIPLCHWEHPGIKKMISVLSSKPFQQEVMAMGGYDLRDCGRVIWSTEPVD
ncbi:MAG: molybdopterin biosynthesis protein [Bacillota bacterium]